NIAQARKDAGAALAALRVLGDQVRNTRYDQETVAAILKKMASTDDQAMPRMSWEEMQQFTLAVAALRPNLKSHLDRVNEMLAYPPGGESPARFRRTPRADSDLDEAVRALRKALR